MKIRYSSNNSGGSWRLSDKDWEALEKDGWVVEWKDERWLGALATAATLECGGEDEAIRRFEAVTGQYAEGDGCDCCGPPHYFYEASE